MIDSSSPIINHEMIAIRGRRQAAGLSRSDALPEDEVPVRSVSTETNLEEMNLIGVAMCGSGDLAGTFCTGVIDALRRSGFLRYIDYVSSTGGGSYAAAALLTQELELRDQNRDGMGPNSTSTIPNPRLSLELSECIRETPWRTSISYQLILGLAVLSLLIPLSAMIALICNSFRHVPESFFGAPGVWPFGCCYITVLALPFMPHSYALKYLLVTNFFTILIGLVISLGIQDSHYTLLTTEQRLQLKIGLPIIWFVCVLPWRRPHHLLTLEQRPRNQVDIIIFQIAYAALVMGPFLALIYYFGMPGVSRLTPLKLPSFSDVFDADQVYRLLIAVTWVAGLALPLRGHEWNRSFALFFIRQVVRSAYFATINNRSPEDLHKKYWEIATKEIGFPYLIFGATRHLPEPDSNLSCMASYEITENYLGSYIPNRRNDATPNFDLCSLAEVAAVSGAGSDYPSPRSPLLFILMFAFGFKVGRWLPNPAHPQSESFPANPSNLELARDWFRSTRDRRFHFVSDGDDAQCLALLPLLRRRCKLIVLVDATCDLKLEFAEFARLVRRLRLIDGITFAKNDELEPVLLSTIGNRSEDGLCRQHSFALNICYPGGCCGTLLYLKRSLTGDEEIDIGQYAREHQEFPHQRWVNTLCLVEQLESYRRLGDHIGAEVFEGILEGVSVRQQVSAGDLAEWLKSKDARLRTVRGAIEDSVKEEVTDQLGRIVSGPPLQNYEGHLCAMFTDLSGQPLLKTSRGLQYAESRGECRLVVWLQPTAPFDGIFNEVVSIQNGIKVARMSCDISADSDQIALAATSHRLITSSASASKEIRFDFTTPHVEGELEIEIWIQMMQQNRLIQVLAARLAVVQAAVHPSRVRL